MTTRELLKRHPRRTRRSMRRTMRWVGPLDELAVTNPFRAMPPPCRLGIPIGQTAAGSHPVLLSPYELITNKVIPGPSEAWLGEIGCGKSLAVKVTTRRWARTSPRGRRRTRTLFVDQRPIDGVREYTTLGHSLDKNFEYLDIGGTVLNIFDPAINMTDTERSDLLWGCLGFISDRSKVVPYIEKTALQVASWWMGVQFPLSSSLRTLKAVLNGLNEWHFKAWFDLSEEATIENADPSERAKLERYIENVKEGVDSPSDLDNPAPGKTLVMVGNTDYSAYREACKSLIFKINHLLDEFGMLRGRDSSVMDYFSAWAIGVDFTNVSADARTLFEMVLNAWIKALRRDPAHAIDVFINDEWWKRIRDDFFLASIMAALKEQRGYAEWMKLATQFFSDTFTPGDESSRYNAMTAIQTIGMLNIGRTPTNQHATMREFLPRYVPDDVIALTADFPPGRFLSFWGKHIPFIWDLAVTREELRLFESNTAAYAAAAATVWD